MKKFKVLKWSRWIFWAILILSVASCAPNADELTESPAETQGVVDNTEMPAPTLTATAVDLAPVVILVASPEADPVALSQIQAALLSLTQGGGLSLDTRENLTPGELASNVKIVVGVGPGLDLNSLAVGATQTAFVAIDAPDAVPTNNVSVIGDPVPDQQQQAFMAGYLAALVSTDYKIAALVPSDSDNTNQIVDAFVIGARFFCGICQQKYPPYNAFPQWETMAAGDAVNSFVPVVDPLIANGVEVLFVQGSIASPELLTYLAESDVKVVGDRSPGMARNNWVGTISQDPGPALVELWPELLNGSGGKQVSASVILEDTAAGLISEGRLRLFEEMAADLEAGLVSPVTAP